jgi:GNAT superfamily N-acetyltransferase
VEGRRAGILNICTGPAHRCQGIARLVMEPIPAWRRAEGFVAVALHAGDDGRALYQALRFQPASEMRLRLG